jgi:hypothetical protein
MSLILRQIKGEKLTIPEMDGNLTYLESLATSNSGSNYEQNVGLQTTILSGATGSIVSVSITINNHPVLVTVTGDANNATAGGWCHLQLHRDGSPIGNIVQCESSGANENVPYSISYVDEPGTGNFTYTLEAVAVNGSDFVFGEADGPVIIAIELVTGGGDNWNESDNSVVDSTRSNSKGGEDNVICCSVNSTIIGGSSNEICGINDGYYSRAVCNSGIFGGCDNLIYDSVQSVIIGGYCNKIEGFTASGRTSNSAILAGCYNCITDNSDNSAIIVGYENCISNNSCNSAILGSYDSCMCCNVITSTIISGDDHCMEGGFSYFNNPTAPYGQYCTTGFVCNSSMLGGCDNRIMNEVRNSVIIGGQDSFICGTVCQLSESCSYTCRTCDSAIIGSEDSYIINSQKSTIIGSEDAKIFDSCYSQIIGSKAYNYGYGGYADCNQILDSRASSIISVCSYNGVLICDSNSSSIIASSGGEMTSSSIAYSTNVVIIGSNEGLIVESVQSFILGGCENCLGILGGYFIGGVQYSGILGGEFNDIFNSCSSTIIGGRSNSIYGASGSICSRHTSIIGGADNNISGSLYSSIIGGQLNSMTASNYSVIIGGSNFSLDTCSDVVMVPKLITGTFGSMAAWKLGATASAVGATVQTDQYIEVEVNGITYKLALIS